MKKELLNIYQYKYGHLSESKSLLEFAEQILDNCEQQREHTTATFRAFLAKYNFDTIPEFKEYNGYPYVTLFKGSDTWTLVPVIDYDGDVTDVDKTIGYIFKDPEIYLSTDDQDIEDISWNISTEVILTWLTSIWFEIDGPNFGIIVKTLENNSSEEFIFNDLAWDDLSIYNRQRDTSKPVEKFFKQTPDLLTIYQRVVLQTYPVYPYHNRWRFFKKGELVQEMVTYGNETGLKEAEQSMDVMEIIVHENLLDTLKFELNTSLNFIEHGYIEYLLPSPRQKPIYKGAIETHFHSGQHWYVNEQNNRLSREDIQKLELRHDIRLPHHYRHYLRLFNGRKYNNINMNFFAGKDTYLKVEVFYDLQEMDVSLRQNLRGSFLKSLFKKKSNAQWIAIGKDDKGNELMLELDSEMVGLRNSDQKITSFQVSFERFIKHPR